MFNDASGARASAIQWGSRIFLALVVLLGTALALTLSTHVSVPGLERLVPGPDAREARPVAHTGSSNPPAEQATVATDSSPVRAQPSTRPTTGRAGVPSTDAASLAEARRARGPTTAQPTAGPSSARTVGRTKTPRTVSASRPTASPTVRAGGQGTERPRNPKAATPSPRNEQAPGQTRSPKLEPTTDIG